MSQECLRKSSEVCVFMSSLFVVPKPGNRTTDVDYSVLGVFFCSTTLYGKTIGLFSLTVYLKLFS